MKRLQITQNSFLQFRLNHKYCTKCYKVNEYVIYSNKMLSTKIYNNRLISTKITVDDGYNKE